MSHHFQALDLSAVSIAGSSDLCTESPSLRSRRVSALVCKVPLTSRTSQTGNLSIREVLMSAAPRLPFIREKAMRFQHFEALGGTGRGGVMMRGGWELSEVFPCQPRESRAKKKKNQTQNPSMVSIWGWGGEKKKKKSLSTIGNLCGHTLGQRETMENKSLMVARMGGSRTSNQ